MNFRSLLIVPAFLLLAGCTANSYGLALPLPDADDRPMLLTFGMYVTPDPDQNPIDPPERFIGYHTGLDFEIFPNEKDAEVPVYAICEGKVTYSGFAEGYGGLVAQRCTISGEEVSIIYGHLALDGLPRVGTTLKKSRSFALLAAAKSHDSDDNRKHLHLTIHKGTEAVYLGYVQTKGELKDFIDPQSVLPL
jgi:hypothetical protein